MSTIETSGLSIAELRLVARETLADRASWEPHVQASPERREYKLLRRDDSMMVWLISWMDGHDTGYHDHDVSAGAVAVAQGSVRDERLRVGGAPASRVYSAGETFTFEVSEIHRVTHVSGKPAVTIHAYSPPLERSGAYVFD